MTTTILRSRWKGDDIRFNYQLMPGRAGTRNAIRLLGIIGYDEDFIREAEPDGGGIFADRRMERQNQEVHG